MKRGGSLIGGTERRSGGVVKDKEGKRGASLLSLL